MAQQPLVGQVLPIIENSLSHSNTHNSVGLLWTSDQPDEEKTDNTWHSQDIDIHAPAGFEPTIPATERPQTHALDREATGIGIDFMLQRLFLPNYKY
jgi:hypothetical protein